MKTKQTVRLVKKNKRAFTPTTDPLRLALDDNSLPTSTPSEPAGLDDGMQNPEGGTPPPSAEPTMSEADAILALLGPVAPPRIAPPLVTDVPTTGPANFRGRGHFTHLGIPAGLRRNSFQDELFRRNQQEDMHWSDAQLAAAMDLEHPDGLRIASRPGLVGTIRAVYNSGRHSSVSLRPNESKSVSYTPAPTVTVAAVA